MVSIAPLRRIFDASDFEQLHRKFYKHWQKCKDTDDHFVVDGVDVYSFYGAFKHRYFYNVDADALNYYSCVVVSDDRGFLADSIKRYHQALVITDDNFATYHSGFARRVIREVMFEHYIDSLLITDHEQTADGFKMWVRLVYESFRFNQQAVAFINGERKLVCPIQSVQDFRQYQRGFEDAIYGANYKYADRGFFLLKRPLLDVLKDTPRIEIVSPNEFIEYGLNA